MSGMFLSGGLLSQIEQNPKGQIGDKPILDPLYSKNNTSSTRPITAPPTPPIEVIALNRISFGPRPGDFEHFRSLGSTQEEQLQSYVSQQLNPSNIDNSVCEMRLDAMNFSTLDKSLVQLFNDHLLYEGDDYEYRMMPFVGSLIATWIKAVYVERQLFEVLVDFWHNHFNIYGWDFYCGAIFSHYDRADLQVTTDYRQVISEILIRRFSNPYLGVIFPNYDGYEPLGVVNGSDIDPIYSSQFSVYLPLIHQ